MGIPKDKFVVIIPALNPDKKLLSTLTDLKEAGFHNLILVNDGSGAEYTPIFEEAKIIMEKAVVLKHSVNLGQGRAYKTGFNYYLEQYPDSIGVLQCDADGQHHVDDVNKCAELLFSHPNEFILGVRNFDDKKIPFRSRFGNKCTEFVFKFLCGINIKDTQTGLKGIPREAVKYLMETPGERFEYATSVLLEIHKRNIPIRQFDIQTIYIGKNESSHFNPLVDSVRIYSTILKFSISSLITVGIDLFIFGIMVSVLQNTFEVTKTIFLSNAIAKVFSGIVNFVFNKRVVFASDNNDITEGIKYILLCIAHIFASSVLVSAILDWVGLPEVVIKMCVDLALFLIVYYIQRVWVFRKDSNER